MSQKSRLSLQRVRWPRSAGQLRENVVRQSRFDAGPRYAAANSSSTAFASFRSRVSPRFARPDDRLRASNAACPRQRRSAVQCFRASTRKATMVFSPSALAASSRCRPSTSTKRAPSALTRMGACRPLVEDARRDLVYSFLFERATTLGRNVDVSDWDGFALHHDEPRNSQPQPATSIRLLRFTSRKTTARTAITRREWYSYRLGGGCAAFSASISSDVRANESATAFSLTCVTLPDSGIAMTLPLRVVQAKATAAGEQPCAAPTRASTGSRSNVRIRSPEWRVGHDWYCVLCAPWQGANLSL